MSEEVVPRRPYREFRQDIPRMEWTIPHGLGIYPEVIVLDEGKQVVEAEIIHVDSNNILIKFNQPQTGWAIIK